MEEVKIIELTERDTIGSDHYVITETEDGTRKVKAKNLRSLAAKSLYFDSIEDLKTSDVQLVEGDICSTLGYHEPGDGGGSIYRIEYNPGIVEDKRYVHYLSYSDTLRAVILLDDKVNVHQFGAYGDGSHDDSAAIQAAIDSGKKVLFNSDCRYVVRTAITVTELNRLIDGYGCTIVPKFCEAFIIGQDGACSKSIKMHNFNIDATDVQCAIRIKNCNNTILDNFRIDKLSNQGIVIKSSKVAFNNLFINGKQNTMSYGIVLDAPSSTQSIPGGCDYNNDIIISNISIIDVRYGIYGYMCHASGRSHTCYVDNILVERTASSANTYFFAFIICNMEIISIRNYSGKPTSDKNRLYNALSIEATCTRVKAFIENLYILGEKTINLRSNTSMVYLSGVIRNLYGSSIATASVFGELAGDVYSTVLWGNSIASDMFTVSGTAIGRMHDSNNPLLYKERTNTTARINLTKDKKNQCFDTTVNISGIDGGIDGQIIAIRSSSNRSLVYSQNHLEIKSSTVALNPYSYVQLQRKNGIWYQIS